MQWNGSDHLGGVCEGKHSELHLITDDSAEQASSPWNVVINIKKKLGLVYVDACGLEWVIRIFSYNNARS